MGVTERKAREREQREEAIITAAKRVFLRKGLILSTMDDIAAEAELAKGTLYRHYRSKEDLMLVINERAMQELHAQFLQALEEVGPSTGLAKLLRLVQAYYEFGQANPAYFSFIAFFESPFPTTSVSTLYKTSQASRALVRQLVLQGMADGSIRTDLEVELLVNILWAGSYGIMQLVVTRGPHLVADQGLSLHDLFATYLATVESGLRAGAPPR